VARLHLTASWRTSAGCIIPREGLPRPSGMTVRRVKVRGRRCGQPGTTGIRQVLSPVLFVNC
jgi:hypothetical protein